MKFISKILILILISSCASVPEEQSNETSTTSSTSTITTTSTTIPVDPFLVTTTEELPEAAVRIVVSSTKAELTDELEIEIFEYEGTGSGFFISSDGYIVTNNHVVAGAVTIEVYTSQRTKPYTGKLIGQSECDDLAILKIDTEENKYLEFSDEEPKLGQEILAIGFPRGDEEVTFLDGIVSKKEANGGTSWASIDYAFEHTAEILPGSSGGPVVNEDVKVIGIAYAGNEDRQEFGIPIVVVKDKINQIINQEFEYTFKANVQQFYGLGLYVYSVDSNSPLKKVGLQGGEIITEIKGLSIIEEGTLKVYCDALLARNPDIGINFIGISLNTFEEFEVEVSLNGEIADEISRDSVVASPPPSDTTKTTVFIPEVKNKITDPPVTFYEISEGKLSIEDYPTVTYELASYIETTTSNCDISLNPSAHEGGSSICNEVIGIGFAYSTIGAVNDSDKRIFSLIDTNLDGTTDYLCAPSVTDYYDDRFCMDVFGTGTGGWVYRNKVNSGWGYEYELINVYAIYKTSEGDYLKITGLPVSKEYFNDIPDFNNSTYKIEVAYCEMDYISDAYGIDQLTFSQNSRGTSFSVIYCGYESFGRNFISGDYFFNLRTTVYNDNNENNFISSFAGSNNGILPFDNYSKRLFPK
jgi:S1-C subfamily serine protease